MIMHDGEGTGETEGREYSGILFGQQKLEIPEYIFEVRVDTGDLPAWSFSLGFVKLLF